MRNDREFCPTLAGIYEDTREAGMYLLISADLTEEMTMIEALSCDEAGVCLGEDEYLYVTGAACFGRRVSDVNGE